MVAKRLLSPRSVWDVELVKQSFAEAQVKESHIPRLYRQVDTSGSSLRALKAEGWQRLTVLVWQIPAQEPVNWI